MYWSTFTKPRSDWILVFSMPIFSVMGARATATSTFSAFNFLGFQFLRLAIDAKGDLDAALGLLHLLDLGVHKAVDAALPIDAHQLLRHLFVFDRYVTRQHLEDGHVRAERLVVIGRALCRERVQISVH